MDDMERIPLNGTFELTARCNLGCKMCLIRIDNQRMSELGGRERTADEWIDMAGQIMEQGTLELLITGGEPMLRPDFTKIYKAIASMGFLITLYTNATLVTPQIMEALMEYPPHSLGITVYGASSDTYGKVTGKAAAYDQMLRGVEQLLKLPSNIEIRATIIKDNLEDLNQITKWALNLRSNITFRVTRIVTKPVRGGIADVKACRLTPEQNAAMIKSIADTYFMEPFHKLVKEKPDLNFDEMINQARQKPEEKQRTLYGCSAGMNSYAITWDGRLIGCQMLGDCSTDPFDQGFQYAWDEFPEKVELMPVPRECENCNIPCNSCPATRLSETGSTGGMSEYLCREGKLAYELDEELTADIQQTMKEKGRIDYAAI